MSRTPIVVGSVRACGDLSNGAMDDGSGRAVEDQQTNRPQPRSKKIGQGRGLAQPPLHKIPVWRGQRGSECIWRLPCPIEKHDLVMPHVVGIALITERLNLPATSFIKSGYNSGRLNMAAIEPDLTRFGIPGTDRPAAAIAMRSGTGRQAPFMIV